MFQFPHLSAQGERNEANLVLRLYQKSDKRNLGASDLPTLTPDPTYISTFLSLSLSGLLALGRGPGRMSVFSCLTVTC